MTVSASELSLLTLRSAQQTTIITYSIYSVLVIHDFNGGRMDGGRCTHVVCSILNGRSEFPSRCGPEIARSEHDVCVSGPINARDTSVSESTLYAICDRTWSSLFGLILEIVDQLPTLRVPRFGLLFVGHAVGLSIRSFTTASKLFGHRVYVTTAGR